MEEYTSSNLPVKETVNVIKSGFAIFGDDSHSIQVAYLLEASVALSLS